MRSPLRSLPPAVTRWTRIARGLRALDAVAAWLALWLVGVLLFEDAAPGGLAVLAAVGVAAGAWMAPLRIRWRPVSAGVGVLLSAGLRPGDQAWFVRPGDAELVLVTGCRGNRLVIARGGGGPSEGISVRRTRVLLLKARR
jgi:hypothetical protein